MCRILSFYRNVVVTLTHINFSTNFSLILTRLHHMFLGDWPVTTIFSDDKKELKLQFL